MTTVDLTLGMWPHQADATRRGLDAVRRGLSYVLLVCPTGGGKSRIAAALTADVAGSGLGVTVYTSRLVLLDQISGTLDAAGIGHGVRAADAAADAGRLVQVSSIATELARVGRGNEAVHPSRLVIVDEAHQQQGKQTRDLLKRHAAAGATIVEMTATPIGLVQRYDEVITAGVVSDLRACGALVPAMHYGPDEPDASRVNAKVWAALKEGKDADAESLGPAVMTTGVFGRVFEWWQRLNPDQLPTILFAPGVGESLWFAEQFRSHGIASAHIDGKNVWVGEEMPGGRAARQDLLAAVRDGRVKVVCNRFVLREGFDAPYLRHGIFATMFGSLASYLQAGGRLLRASEGKDHVVIQDHGGNWHRHGSLNADRDWPAGLTAAGVAARYRDRIRDGKSPEPRRCPACGLVTAGGKCHGCGAELGKLRSRPVVQADGQLREMTGSIYPPRRVAARPNTRALWRAMYFRFRNTSQTFSQAYGLFALEHGYHPPRDLPFMPRADENDWYRRVKDVPMERLR